MPKAKSSKDGGNRYQALIEKIFFDHYSAGCKEVVFRRDELVTAAGVLGVELPKNLGDVPYYFRYRYPMPGRVIATQPPGKQWVIEGVGRARYAFRLQTESHIAPRTNRVTVKIPEATPEIISAYALTDEQALLAKVRYNRLIDIFLGITAYSLQSHLRTTVKGIGQIEIDEVYVGVDRAGRQFIVPVQAKGGKDKLSPVQAKQDIACCAQKFPTLICRAISAQFLDDNSIALMEITQEGDVIKIVDEEHFQLCPSDQISAEELIAYRQRKT